VVEGAVLTGLHPRDRNRLRGAIAEYRQILLEKQARRRAVASVARCCF
jgi:hypothetical protein